MYYLGHLLLQPTLVDPVKDAGVCKPRANRNMLGKAKFRTEPLRAVLSVIRIYCSDDNNLDAGLSDYFCITKGSGQSNNCMF